ncbi:MAG: GNAT family N-acetyltransferase [Fulvivirga sp.]|uniref:GNAT family N-acetyltransferase n=1 Tax=Fulvivirga sp. TaxID=1931237 RepID=UPI0032ED2063
MRRSVTENVLVNTHLVTDAHCAEYIIQRGKGWVCEIDNEIVGFSIVDLTGNNVWALFLKPEFEKQGIGRKLHDIMLDWYFEQTQTTLWLSTSPNTRAAYFYKKAGWQVAGLYDEDEVKFEMTYKNWHKKTLKV